MNIVIATVATFNATTITTAAADVASLATASAAIGIATTTHCLSIIVIIIVT